MAERNSTSRTAAAAAMLATAVVAPAAGAMGAVQSSTALGLDLYRQHAESRGNLLVSPYSVATALAMTYAGARGETAAEMTRTLHVGAGADSVHSDFGALQARLQTPAAGSYELSLANRLFAQNGYDFRREFLGLLRDSYGAPLEQLDFRADPEPPRRHINRWVEGVTRDRIKDLLPAGAVRQDTRLVLVNAVHFLAAWQSPFPERGTKPLRFSSGAESFDVPTMNDTLLAGYAVRDGLQVLELWYRGGEASMVVLLPQAADGLAALERRLSPATLDAWTSDLPAARVVVFLPRWSFTWGADLTSPLQRLGMESAFDCTPTSRADFSGMTGQRDLCLDVVIHEAFIAVDERGTEAAAATATGMAEIISVKPPPSAVFRADHPFMFVIRHRGTGALLFLGRVTDPRPSG